MDRTYRLYLSDAISVDGFKEIFQPLEEQMKALKAEQVRIQAEIDVKSARNLSAEVVADETRQLGQKWAGISASEKHHIVENIVEKIVVDRARQQVEVTLHCVPNAPHKLIDISSPSKKRRPPFCPDAPTQSEASLRESSEELTNSQQAPRDRRDEQLCSFLCPSG